MNLLSLMFGSRESEKFGDSVLEFFAGEWANVLRKNPKQAPVEHLAKLWVGNYSREPEKYAYYLTPDAVEYVTCLHACIPEPDCGLALSLAMLSIAYPQLVAKYSKFEKLYAEFLRPIQALFQTENFEALNKLFDLQNPNYRKRSPFPIGGKEYWDIAKQCGLVTPASALSNVADINAKDESGGTALMDAAKNGYVEITNLLLANGADINAKNINGVTALMWATQRGQLEAVNLLLDKGADINMKNMEGGTALMVAAKKGQVEIAKLLLNKGSDINARTIGGSTALIMAALNGHVEMVKRLLANNADFNAIANGGLTALDAAKKAPGLKTAVARGVIVTLLKQAGAKE